VTPRSKGGGSTWENMVTCCRKCNLKKANNYPKDVGLKLNKKPRPPLVNVLGLRELIELNKCWSKFVG
jgi:5-methylcytosine-specific restriction endonuclease McrA